MNENRNILNVKEIANYLAVSESSIRKAVRENKIPYFRCLSRVLFDKDKIDIWIANQSNYSFQG